MKKIIITLMAATAALSAGAQSNAPAANTQMMTPVHSHGDSSMGRWVIDINGLAGLMTQDLTSANNTSGYLNGLNIANGKAKFSDGTSFGGDVQLGFFFGRKRHWGIGTGFMYLAQQGNLNLDGYHVEYQSTDINGNVFRQIVNGRHLDERVNITNMNIPLVLKYKARFSKHWGFTADAGALFNVKMTSRYDADGTFDYEAIYKYSNTADGTPTVYDNSPTPSSTSELITRNYYNSIHPDGNVQQFFKDQRAAGRNVGLDVKANNSRGTVSYSTGSVGFLVQPSVNYFFSDNVALNVGVYYMYQAFKNNSLNDYRLVSTVDYTGAPKYSSTLNNVTSSNVQSYGVNVGVRLLFGKPKDTDMDGIPDRRDNCPTVWGLPQFNGCPDTDRDGIQDSQDDCPYTPGIAKFRGCPDTDGDGIQDKEDECPLVAGPARTHGCPDRDGDGIADKDDLCPDKFGLAQFHGCPDTDGDGVPDNLDNCPDVPGPVSNNGCPLTAAVVENVPLSTPILFEFNRTVVAVSSYPVLETALKTLQADGTTIIVVNGHADATGTTKANTKLSMKRANAVREQLIKLGADPKRIKVKAKGATEPAASDATPEGRAQNRRAVINLNVQ